METRTMNPSSVKKEKLFFDCANSIEFLKCFGCARFKSCNLIDLHDHLRARHTLFTFKKIPLHNCRSCGFQTFSEFLFSIHKSFDRCLQDGKIPTHSNKCDHCPFTTTDSRSFKRHMSMKHTDPEKIQWIECEQCPYKCRTQRGLKRHVDHNHGKQEYLKCGRCPFETKDGNTLKNHTLWKHTEPENIQWFECERCSLKTKTKSNLKKHMDRMHGKGKFIKCDHCPFETKSIYSLKNHVLAKHTDPEEIQWFQCAQCPHRCRSKRKCSFEIRLKRSLKHHVLSKNTEPEKIEWLQCAQCEYKSKSKYDKSLFQMIR